MAIERAGGGAVGELRHETRQGSFDAPPDLIEAFAAGCMGPFGPAAPLPQGIAEPPRDLGVREALPLPLSDLEETWLGTEWGRGPARGGQGVGDDLGRLTRSPQRRVGDQEGTSARDR